MKENEVLLEKKEIRATEGWKVKRGKLEPKETSVQKDYKERLGWKVLKGQKYVFYFSFISFLSLRTSICPI